LSTGQWPRVQDDLYGWLAHLKRALINCSSGEASAWLGGAGRQAPGSVIGALDQQDASIVSLQGDHCAGHEDEVIANRLP
jgi:hypothetical protein